MVVADSENDRVVEYQRENGEWVQSWVWADSPLSWPRDADRLPSGNTLVADTYGDRVVEVNTNGEVVWSVPAPFVYDAERLGTGDESAGGHSAAALGLASDASATDPEAGEATLSDLIKAQFPPRLIHGLQSVTPFWMGIGAFALLLTWVGSLCGLVVVEFRYRDHGIRLRSPVTREQSRDCERVSNEE